MTQVTTAMDEAAQSDAMRLLAAVLGLIIALAGCASPSSEPLPEGTDATPAFFGADGDPFLGDPDAAVQVVAYDAPGCSSCKRYHDNAFPTIKAEFIDTGKIGYHAVQWRVYPTYDTEGGIALECVYREGSAEDYFALVDVFFADLLRVDARNAAEDYAAENGLDVDAVLACYDGQETLDEVQADIRAGLDSGAGSNPGFAVIGPDGVMLIRGSQGPYDAIVEALG